MQRAGHRAFLSFHPTGAERAAAVRARVVQRVELAAHVEDGDALAGDLDGLALAGRQGGGIEGGRKFSAIFHRSCLFFFHGWSGNFSGSLKA